jgi:hypothetical protein
MLPTVPDNEYILFFIIGLKIDLILAFFQLELHFLRKKPTLHYTLHVGK